MFPFGPTRSPFSTSLFYWICVLVNEINAMSSAHSRSSSFVLNLHVTPFSPFRTALHVIQSMMVRNRKPDMLHPCFTPSLILKQSVVSPASMTVHSKLMYKAPTTLMIFTGMPYDFILVQRLFLCTESKVYTKLMYKDACHSLDCSILLHSIKIWFVVLLPGPVA